MAKRAITSRDSMRQVRLHVAKRAKLWALATPSLILNPVGPCQPSSRTLKATWATETAVSPPTFLSFTAARYIFRGYSRHIRRQLSLPVNRPCKIIVLTPPFQSLSNSDAPMKNRICRIGTPRSFTLGDLQLPLNVFACRFNHRYIFSLVSLSSYDFNFICYLLLILTK